MKKLSLIALFALLASNIFAQANLDDLIRHPENDLILLSPEGDKIAVHSEIEGKMVVMFYTLNPIELVNVFQFSRSDHVGSFEWVSNERIILQVLSKNGELDTPVNLGLLYGVDYTGKDLQLLFGYLSGTTSTSRIQGREADLAAASPVDPLLDDSRKVLINTFPWGNMGNFETVGQVDELDVYTGRQKKVSGLPQIGAQAYLDHSHKVRLATATDKEGNAELYLRESDSRWTLIESEVNGVNSQPVGFSADNNIAYIVSNNGEDLSALYSLNLTSLEKELISRDPEVDIVSESVIWNPDHTNPIGVRSEPNYPTYKLFDYSDEYTSFFDSLLQTFGGQRIAFQSYTADGTKGILKVDSDTHPGKFYLVDIAEKSVSYLTSTASWLDDSSLNLQDAFAITSNDGLVLRGYVTYPSTSRQNLPMIVMPHGGPYARDVWGFNQDAQIFASNGYSVLQLNFRGSTGYGKEFSHAADNVWGRDVQDDIAQAVNWAIQEGIADADRICIYGGSFGGYSALMSAITHGGLYQCAAGYAGVYDLNLTFQTGDIQQSRRGNAYLRGAIGEDENNLNEQSPVARASEIEIPIFLAHGTEDRRAPIAHAEAMIAALEENGIDYEWLEKEGEGHGFYAVEVRKEFYTKLLAFFDEHTRE